MKATYGEAFVDDLQIITSNEYNKLLLYDNLIWQNIILGIRVRIGLVSELEYFPSTLTFRERWPYGTVSRMLPSQPRSHVIRHDKESQ